MCGGVVDDLNPVFCAPHALPSPPSLQPLDPLSNTLLSQNDSSEVLGVPFFYLLPLAAHLETFCRAAPAPVADHTRLASSPSRWNPTLRNRSRLHLPGCELDMTESDGLDVGWM